MAVTSKTQTPKATFTIADLNRLRLEQKTLQALQAQTLKGDFPKCYSHFSKTGRSFDTTQELILRDLLSKITANNTKTNIAQNSIDNDNVVTETAPSEESQKKKGVSFGSDTKTHDGGRRQKKVVSLDKEEKDTRRVLTARESVRLYHLRAALKEIEEKESQNATGSLPPTLASS